MLRLKLRLYVTAATAALCLVALQPRVADAQATGVGSDGNTSLLWKGTDSSIVLWRLDRTVGSVIASQSYGPYLGYTPVALTTDVANYTHVLWRYTDGRVTIWSLDPALNFSSNVFFGPYFGWTALSMSSDPSTGSLRVVWKRTDGALAIFVIAPTGALAYEGVYGPFLGYEPVSAGMTGPKALQVPARMPSMHRADGKSHAAAAASMAAQRSTKLAPSK